MTIKKETELIESKIIKGLIIIGNFTKEFGKYNTTIVNLSKLSIKIKEALDSGIIFKVDQIIIPKDKKCIK